MFLANADSRSLSEDQFHSIIHSPQSLLFSPQDLFWGVFLFSPFATDPSQTLTPVSSHLRLLCIFYFPVIALCFLSW